MTLSIYVHVCADTHTYTRTHTGIITIIYFLTAFQHAQILIFRFKTLLLLYSIHTEAEVSQNFDKQSKGYNLEEENSSLRPDSLVQGNAERQKTSEH